MLQIGLSHRLSFAISQPIAIAYVFRIYITSRGSFTQSRIV